MEKIRLSSPAERRGAWFLAAVLLLIIVFIMKALRASTGFIILISLCGVLSMGIAVMYLIAVYKASVEKAGLNKLKISGLLTLNEDYTGATSVKTVPVTMGPLQSRSIELCNEAGNAICTISTLFTHHEGVLAEPAAEELAKNLGLEFIPTVEKWKYDADALAEHKAELKRIKKEKRKHRKKGASESEEIIKEEKAEEINYDSLDDQR